MYRQSEKNLLSSNASSTWPRNMVKFGQLTAEMVRKFGAPCKFQRVSHLGSVTARHFSNGSQPNFAALKRGRHLYSAGRLSRWTLAHILVRLDFCIWQSSAGGYSGKYLTAGTAARVLGYTYSSMKLRMCRAEIFIAV